MNNNMAWLSKAQIAEIKGIRLDSIRRTMNRKNIPSRMVNNRKQYYVDTNSLIKARPVAPRKSVIKVDPDILSYTVAGAAKACDRKPHVIYRAINSGKLPAVRLKDGSYWIDASTLHKVFPKQPSMFDAPVEEVALSAPETIAPKQHVFDAPRAAVSLGIRDFIDLNMADAHKIIEKSKVEAIKQMAAVIRVVMHDEQYDRPQIVEAFDTFMSNIGPV